VTQSTQQPSACLPDAAVCRARKFGSFAAFAECLTEESEDCAYALSAGEKKLCFHPECAAIVVRTNDSLVLVGK